MCSAGIAVGAGIHGFVPAEFLASFMGKDAAWWSVPLAVVMGVPMYANAAGILPGSKPSRPKAQPWARRWRS